MKIVISARDNRIISTGFFVVPRSLNARNANICAQVGYRDLYSCSHNSGVDPDFLSHFKLFYDLSDTDMIYQEASAHEYSIQRRIFNYTPKLLRELLTLGRKTNVHIAAQPIIQ
jgi:hypothetical protein